jgi:hypothetical protein
MKGTTTKRTQMGTIQTNPKVLPTREIAYHYAVAMHFAQQFERDLRAILWTADYHRWIEEIPLTHEQRRRFTDFEGFIDKSTCGLVMEKLRRTATVKGKKVWRAFNLACTHRNSLAHSFLADHTFEHLTPAKEKEIIRRIQRMALNIYKALCFSKILRAQVEAMSDQEHDQNRAIMKKIGSSDDYEAPNRKYDTRKREKTKKGRG